MKWKNHNFKHITTVRGTFYLCANCGCDEEEAKTEPCEYNLFMDVEE